MLTLPAGFALLIGGLAAVALGERALGGTLMALAVATIGAGWIMLARIKNKTLSAVRASRQQRQADPDRAFRHPDGPPAPYKGG
jgi:hypothetical protein